MSDNWTRRERPERLEARVEFPDYDATRTFLEEAAEISSQEEIYPDISFGRTYVNLTLHSGEGVGIGAAEERYARHIDRLLAQTA